MTRHYIGADLSKDWIDLYHPKSDTHHKITNDRRSIVKLLEQMQEDEVLIFEATSGCNDILLAEIRKASTPFVRANPVHAWYFARACNLPKTDRVDARMLSAFGTARMLKPQVVNSIARDHLKSLVRRRRQYKDMITQEKNKLKRMYSPKLKRDIQSLLNLLERRVAKLEKQIREQLGITDRRQIVSLAGLAPRAHESGKFKGKRKLGAGRRHIRSPCPRVR